MSTYCEGLDDGKFIREDEINKIKQQTRKETLEEVEEKIEEYFKGLVMIPFPHKTKEQILNNLKDL